MRMDPDIPVFYLLPPTEIPCGRRAFDGISEAARHALLSDWDARKLCPTAVEVSGPDFDVSSNSGGLAGPADHDSYCNVIRVTGDHPRIFIRTIFQADRELADEKMPGDGSVESDRWLQLERVFEWLLRWVLRQPVERPAIRIPVSSRPLGFNPVRRWIVGHHVFLTLIQGLILVFRDLTTALQENDDGEARRALALAAALMRSTSLAFRFATDYGAKDYETVVRPTMMPPQSPPGLSGILSSDHSSMLEILGSLKSRLEALTPPVRESYLEFRAAFREAYEAHKLVCSRFQGGEKPSLRMTPGTKNSAVDVLDRLGRARFRMLPVGPSTQSKSTVGASCKPMLNRLLLTEPLCEYMLNVSVCESETLRRLREETALMPLAEMQIPPEQGQFLAFLVQLAGAKKTLEIGVFTGYSTLWTAAALPPDGRVIACDINEEWTAIARRYWCEAGVADRIDLRLGPAAETLAQLLGQSQADSFDFIFIDADKANYGQYYDYALQLTRPGGLIAIDNTLRSGEVIDPAITETGTVAIRELNERLRCDNRIVLSLLPIADGLTLAMKRDLGRSNGSI